MWPQTELGQELFKGGVDYAWLDFCTDRKKQGNEIENRKLSKLIIVIVFYSSNVAQSAAALIL